MAELRGLLKNNDRARRAWLLFLRGPRNEGFRTSRSLVWPLKFIIRSNYHLFYIRDELFYLLKIITCSKQCKVALIFTASVTAFNLFTFFHADINQSEVEDSFQLASDWIKSAWKNVNKPKPVTLLGSFLSFRQVVKVSWVSSLVTYLFNYFFMISQFIGLINLTSLPWNFFKCNKNAN